MCPEALRALRNSKFAATRATGTYLNLPSHSEVMIKGRVHFFDQWTGPLSTLKHRRKAALRRHTSGQSVYMKLGNTIVWTGTVIRRRTPVDRSLPQVHSRVP